MTISPLETFIQQHPRLLVLTGAGVSLGSGIPTYRDENGVWQRGAPMQHPDFIRSEATRRRYWARSFAGWPLMTQAQPNSAHQALARLEQLGHVALLVTQNVDNLHQRAGSRDVVDLHGNLQRVMCLSCEQRSTRTRMQRRLVTANPWLERLDAAMRPDGDAELDETRLEQLQIPACLNCGGVLMPDVVFFGGTIPPQRVAECLAALQQADALLVVGSSLKVYSGYRFCLRAREWGKPLALINPGWTRADDLASLKVTQPCAAVLEALVSRPDAVSAALFG
ncbi:MAG: NAD-dependent protein deacetylase [Thiothrix sp.]|nr:NAD-dependent protein deacetylase [Thiothrix sp.]HPE61787.1 NAD-dependent protein deacetylase [Thiolinea sp.]